MTQPIIPSAGIDIGKDKLDIAIRGHREPFALPNEKAGWRQLARELKRCGVERVGMEATGGYERGVAQALRKAGFTVLILQPMQTKAFAKLHMRRAKNDRIDAALIAACTELIQAPSLEHDPRMSDLADHLTFIEQIEEDIARAKNRLEHIHTPRLQAKAKLELKRLQRNCEDELRRLEEELAAEADLALRLDLVRSIPGLGTRTAITLLVRMPELGKVSREQAAALAGLAPFDDDSAQRHGQRHIAGGRGRLRRSLYLAALPAAFMWNPALKALYQRMKAAGKAHQCALVACARKLLVFANTVVARGTPWVARKA